MKRKIAVVILLLAPLVLGACSLFTSHYDATRHENFTKLKAVHAKFFEDWTEGSDRSWNEAAVSSYCDKGDLSFREAHEYAKSKDKSDGSGQRAVKILWDEFSANCDLSMRRKALFSKVFTAEIFPQIEQNYNYAIQGELSRLNATQ